MKIAIGIAVWVVVGSALIYGFDRLVRARKKQEEPTGDDYAGHYGVPEWLPAEDDEVLTEDDPEFYNG